MSLLYLSSHFNTTRKTVTSKKLETNTVTSKKLETKELLVTGIGSETARKWP